MLLLELCVSLGHHYRVVGLIMNHVSRTKYDQLRTMKCSRSLNYLHAKLKLALGRQGILILLIVFDFIIFGGLLVWGIIETLSEEFCLSYNCEDTIIILE